MKKNRLTLLLWNWFWYLSYWKAFDLLTYNLWILLENFKLFTGLLHQNQLDAKGHNWESFGYISERKGTLFGL